jgi:hypothetical protein
VSKSPYFEGKKSLEATIFSQCYPQGRHNKAYDSKHALLSHLTSSQIWVIPLLDDFPGQVPISQKWGKEKKKKPFIFPLVKFGSFLLWND